MRRVLYITHANDTACELLSEKQPPTKNCRAQQRKSNFPNYLGSHAAKLGAFDHYQKPTQLWLSESATNI